MPEAGSGRWRRWRPSEFANCEVAEDAQIEAEEAVIGEGTRIEAGACIRARRILIGTGGRLERETSAQGLGAPMDVFQVGDQSLIGFATQILCPSFSMGDYSQLHNNGLHSGYKPLRIGHNCWIGQHSILNCTEQLTIGNNVRIGTQSQLWTHVASGELLEGCTLFNQIPLVLEDNVWIVGGAVISPGLRLARNSIIMTGSVLTKSTEPFHTYAGVPARDVTDKLNFWKPQTLEEKIRRMRDFVSEFVATHPGHEDRIRVAGNASEIADAHAGDVIFVGAVDDWRIAAERRVSLFDLTAKTYLKQRSPTEIDWMRWSVGYRARFVPREG